MDRQSWIEAVKAELKGCKPGTPKWLHCLMQYWQGVVSRGASAESCDPVTVLNAGHCRGSEACYAFAFLCAAFDVPTEILSLSHSDGVYGHSFVLVGPLKYVVDADRRIVYADRKKVLTIQDLRARPELADRSDPSWVGRDGRGTSGFFAA